MFASSYGWFKPAGITYEWEDEGIRLCFNGPGSEFGFTVSFGFDEAHDFLRHLQAVVQVMEQEPHEQPPGASEQDVPF